jgi:hypothetical protein
MLWYKGWLETRIKLAIVTGLVFVFFIFLCTHPATPEHGRRFTFGLVAPVATMSAIWIFIVLAGAGITTQPAFQASKGIHGSTLYSLSLPVSRLRLVGVRAGLGWLESAVAVATLYYGTWLSSPAVRSTVTLTEVGEYAATILVCGSVLYFVSVLLATFLDEQWRTWGTLIASIGWFRLLTHNALPASVDIFGAMGKGSFLVAQTVPWSTLGFSLGVSVALFFAAIKVAQAREY